MLEKPPIHDEEIASGLRAHYRLDVAHIAFLPIGYDAAAWAYRVTAANGQRFFLKLRRGTIHCAPPAIARYLRDQSIAAVVAPLPTTTCQLFAGYGAVEVDALALAYYRFEWCAQEFADFAQRVFVLDDVGDETKADSARGFSQLFDPGDVVEQAHNAARLVWLE